MHIALLGKGKTGSHVAALAIGRPGFECTPFGSSDAITPETLSGCDIVISFLPGPAFAGIIPVLLESRLPVVCGSTGFEFPCGPEAFDRYLRAEGLCWVYASNFSAGMQLVQQILPVLAGAEQILESTEFAINEIHHSGKRDAPSGTALSWRDWLGPEVTDRVQFTFERFGDVIGTHELVIRMGFEEIRLRHEVSDRRVFAEGALRAADWIMDQVPLPESGLHDYSRVIRHQLSTQRHNVS